MLQSTYLKVYVLRFVSIIVSIQLNLLLLQLVKTPSGVMDSQQVGATLYVPMTIGPLELQTLFLSKTVCPPTNDNLKLQGIEIIMIFSLTQNKTTTMTVYNCTCTVRKIIIFFLTVLSWNMHPCFNTLIHFVFRYR